MCKHLFSKISMNIDLDKNSINLSDTVKMITSLIQRCENVRPKLKEGSAQLSLNTNRLKALYIGRDILLNQKKYEQSDIDLAIVQIGSILNKSKSGLNRAKIGLSTYTRFSKIIYHMNIVLMCLEKSKNN